MTTWKMPPKAKVYEALSAIADNRVSITGRLTAQVLSSSRDKMYDVEWSEDHSEITANDNASYWQGYTGYPIIAVLLQTGRIPFNPHIAQRLADIPWKSVNQQFKRDYDKAINHILDGIEAAGGDRMEIVREVEKIYEQLETLKMQRSQRRRRPPQSKSS
jgi:hypothetical protein